MSKAKKIHIEWDPFKAELIAAVVCVVLVLCIGIYALVAYTPLRRMIPGYPSSEAVDRMELATLKIDSLQRCIYRWELYSANLRDVLAGKAPVKIDSLLKMAGEYSSPAADTSLAKADSALRAKMGVTKDGSASSSYTSVRLSGGGKLFFLPATEGRVTVHFAQGVHPYVDISAPASSPVMAVLDGTVIYKEWTEDDGWTLILQHSGGLISIYRGLDGILKNPSDKVGAGSVVAMLPKGDGDGRTCLQFELWQNGSREDPELFINFRQ